MVILAIAAVLAVALAATLLILRRRPRPKVTPITGVSPDMTPSFPPDEVDALRRH